MRGLIIAAMFISSAAFAPQAGAQNHPPTPTASNGDNLPIVERMMAFDKNHDGKLTRDEITDARLLRLFDEADADKDGVVTSEELKALASRREAEIPPGRRGDGPGAFNGAPDSPDGPPPGREGPGDRDPGAGGPPPQGGRRGPGMRPPAPGQVLPPMLQDRLNLTPEQKAQVGSLQHEVDERLAKILTPEQLKQMHAMDNGGPRAQRDGRGGPPPGENADRPPRENADRPPRENGDRPPREGTDSPPQEGPARPEAR